MVGEVFGYRGGVLEHGKWTFLMPCPMLTPSNKGVKGVSVNYFGNSGGIFIF